MKNLLVMGSGYPGAIRGRDGQWKVKGFDNPFSHYGDALRWWVNNHNRDRTTKPISQADLREREDSAAGMYEQRLS